MQEEGKCFNAIVDRIEGNYAVCELPYEIMIDIELSKIPFQVKENDRLHIEYDSSGSIKVITKIPKREIIKRALKSKFIRFN